MFEHEMRVNWTYKIGTLLLFGLAYMVFYVYPNFRTDTVAAQLPMYWIDREMPFLPWTFLIYLSDYLLFAYALVLLEYKDEFHSFSRLAFATLITCGFFFFFYPTVYPRPEYPPSSFWLGQFAMNLIAVADSPRNCFPSMHVGMTAMAVWGLRHKKRTQVVLLSFWALAIFVSTLTTKQHYALDIVGGLCVLVFVATLEAKILSRMDSQVPLLKR